MRLERRQAALDERLAEGLAAAAGRQRHVVHVGTERIDAGVRIQRVLECAGHQYPPVAREYVFGAVAVMHVEVDDRGALEPVPVERVRDADRDVVEQAETHRCRAADARGRTAQNAAGFPARPDRWRARTPRGAAVSEYGLSAVSGSRDHARSGARRLTRRDSARRARSSCSRPRRRIVMRNRRRACRRSCVIASSRSGHSVMRPYRAGEPGWVM